GLHGVCGGGAAGREPGGGEGGGEQERGGGKPRYGIVRRDAEQQRLQSSRETQREPQSKQQSEGEPAGGAGEDHARDSGRGGAEGHADADFARALRHQKRQHSVESEGGERKADGREQAEEERVEARTHGEARRGGLQRGHL